MTPQDEAIAALREERQLLADAIDQAGKALAALEKALALLVAP